MSDLGDERKPDSERSLPRSWMSDDGSELMDASKLRRGRESGEWTRPSAKPFVASHPLPYSTCSVNLNSQTLSKESDMKSDKPATHPIIPTEPPPPPPTGRLTLPRLIVWCAAGSVLIFGIAKLAVWIMRGGL